MTDFVRFRLRNIATLDEQLAQIEPKLQRKVMRRALRVGGNIVRDEARRRAPVRGGLLRRSIQTRVGRSRRTGQWTASVGVFPAGGRSWPFYAGFVERGHRVHGGGRAVPPRPYLLASLLARQHDVHQAIMDQLASSLNELV